LKGQTALPEASSSTQTDQTEVALTIHYERRLDPAWYFAPMQEFAIGQSADYLIQSVIVREKADE